MKKDQSMHAISGLLFVRTSEKAASQQNAIFGEFFSKFKPSSLDYLFNTRLR